jgi:hypothetical protein
VAFRNRIRGRCFTEVIFSGEFGRTPFAQGADGRDHNPFAVSSWIAGGGVKRGFVYGATYSALTTPKSRCGSLVAILSLPMSMGAWIHDLLR